MHIHNKLNIFIFQNSFYYSLVYDPQQKTLLADKGEIRVGSGYQCPITPLLKEGMAINALNNICYFILKVIWHILRMLVRHKFYKLQHVVAEASAKQKLSIAFTIS